MEFVDGVNLRHLLQERRLKPGEALQIVPQICEALQYAHEQGVVHRDIKPENILVDKQGHVKIADFGLAKLLGPKAADSALTGSQQIMGTPHYMAPEQMERPLAVDHRADIYSLGVVFYEMLTGELPLGQFAPPSQKVQVGVRLDEVVLRALAREPERRYQHASDVKAEVESIASERHPAAGATRSHGVSDHTPFKSATILTLLCLVVWDATLAALSRAYFAQANWYFRKEFPYEWLHTLAWSSFLAALGFGSWWFYLLATRLETPRSFRDYCRVWLTSDRRTRSAWGWFGLWITAVVCALLCFAVEENGPFFWVTQGVLGLTPIALMAVLWWVVWRGGSNPGPLAVGTRQAASPQVRAAPSDHSRLPSDANAGELERLILSLMPDNEFAAIRAYREQMGVPLDHAAEAVEAIARRHGITPRPIPVAAHIGILLCVFGIAASFIPAVIRHVFTHTWAYDELLPDLPAGNERWVSLPVVGLLSWEWTSITATFLTLGLFLIGTRSVQGVATMRAFAMLLGGTVVLVLDVLRVRPVYGNAEFSPTPYVGFYVLGVVSVGLLIVGVMALRFALTNRNPDADAQPMKLLHQQLRSLWESALSLCVGSGVKGASSNLTGDNPNDAHLSGTTLHGDEPEIRRRETAQLSGPEKHGSRGCSLWFLIGLFAFIVVSIMAILKMTQEWSSPDEAAAKVAKKDTERIQGTWAVISLEENGKKAPTTVVVAMAFEGDKVKVIRENDEQEGSFRLDPTQEPKTFDLLIEGLRTPGIYTLEADQLTICLQLSEHGNRPKRFVTDSKSDGLRLMILERQKP
jgi:uncharacterized protein (TIGR03067 family)